MKKATGILLTLMLASQTQAQVQAPAGAPANIRSLALAMAADGQPRDLAFAAMLQGMADTAHSESSSDATAASQRTPEDARIAEWRQAALARGSDDLLTIIMLSYANRTDQAESRAMALSRWQTLEPDNFAPLLYGSMSGDQLVAQAAARGRFDLHIYDQVRWIQSAVVRHPPGPESIPQDMSVDEYGVVNAIAVWTSLAIPPGLNVLSEACRGGALDTTPRRRRYCRAVGRTMLEHPIPPSGPAWGLR